MNINNIDNKKNKSKGSSKVIDSLKSIKEKPSFEKVISSYNKGNIVSFKEGENMYIVDDKNDTLYLEGYFRADKKTLNKKEYSKYVKSVTLNSNKDLIEIDNHCLDVLGKIPKKGDRIFFSDWGNGYHGRFKFIVRDNFFDYIALASVGNTNLLLPPKEIQKINSIPMKNFQDN